MFFLPLAFTVCVTFSSTGRGKSEGVLPDMPLVLLGTCSLGLQALEKLLAQSSPVGKPHCARRVAFGTDTPELVSVSQEGKGSQGQAGCCVGSQPGDRAEVGEVVGAQAAALGSTLGAPKELPREVRPSLVDLAHSLWFKLSERIFPSSPQAVKYLDVLPCGYFPSFTGGAPSYLVLKRAFSAGEWCGLLMGKISERK